MPQAARMPQDDEEVQGLRQLHESLQNPDIFAPAPNPPRSHTPIPQPGIGLWGRGFMGWHQLQGPPSFPNTFVPDTPPPRNQEPGNDTPTPATPMTGSWRHRRRTGEYVERPPQLRVYPPDAKSSTSPVVPSPEMQSPETVFRWEPRATSDPQDSSTPSSLKAERERSGQATEPHDPIEIAPLTRIAPHPSQLDGALEEGLPQGRQRHATLCKKLCKSLRNIPSQLAGVFIKQKKGPPKDEHTGDAASAEGADAADQTWWSKTSKRFGKAKGQSTASTGGRKRRRYGRKSLHGLFSSSAATQPSSSPTTDPFDDSIAPQAFGAPRHEEDSNSPVGLDLGVNTERYLDRQAARAWVLDAARGRSSNCAPARPLVDGTQEEQPLAENTQGRGTWHLARALYRIFLEANGWLPNHEDPDFTAEATTVSEIV
ncbi:MAG: hypothetical protein Q9177_002046 [Variospora cf. flavescens]